ncbi:NADP-dependent oxidoreductase [Latilactobacillus graminis]|uniref:Oxidoreductase zinc-binding protein n=1 Tax=Latilactobacillus graminis DSM 20719 TaxID=1423752 RepID=A0AA89I2K6_9LACO|nr:NADP-dependent oxidoreductase [Latilactobacillus graminis]KRM24230.1 oxidoreductase zinc-binding protein [Latilactobacillus graminis DSM 20719]
MKAAQITRYSKTVGAQVGDIPIPTIAVDEVLIRVKAAAVNPLEMLISSGSVKLIQNYQMPLTIGNELSGIVEKVGAAVTNYQPGDYVYSRLPLRKIGAVAEFAAVSEQAIAKMPTDMAFETATAIPLTGLTAYQGLHEELQAQPGETVFIPGGSGSFGQLAIPIAKAMGLNVIVSGNAATRENSLAIGADRYLDYRVENYWELLQDVDYVIDTLGKTEFERELSIIKPGGGLLSLRTGPNKQFAIDHHFNGVKKFLFSMVGRKFDRLAHAKGVEYRFIFVRADAKQLAEVTKIVETHDIRPRLDPHQFKIDDINEALQLVSAGHPKGKVVITF